MDEIRMLGGRIRQIELVHVAYRGEALDVGPGHRRFTVTTCIDGTEMCDVDVVLTDEELARALRIGLDRG